MATSKQPAPKHIAEVSKADKPERELPYSTLTSTDFEAFCRELVTACYGIPCNKYGDSGESQEGIDAHCRMPDGSLWAFQWKRERRFGPARVKAAIDRTTFAADHYVMALACELSTRAQRLFKSYPKWEHWQASAITGMVRRLPDEIARRILDAYFGVEVRRRFLGQQTVHAIDHHRAFFQSEARGTAGHRWNLRGRANALAALRAWTKTTTPVCLLVGAGGIGKSRLLFEFAEEFDTAHERLRFAHSEILVHTAFDDLPAGRSLLVLDDAHRCECLPFVMLLAQKSKSLRLILVTRTEEKRRIQALLWKRFGRTEITEIELEPLSPDEGTALAADVLGGRQERLSKVIARAADGLPLFVVATAEFVRDQRLDPRLFERSDAFQSGLAIALDEIWLKPVEQEFPQIGRRLLELFALLGPLRSDDDVLLARIATLVSIDVQTVRRVLQKAELVGLVRRTGRFVRVVPDPLADHLVRRAAFEGASESFEFTHAVFNAVRDHAPRSLLANLAALDWRERLSGSNSCTPIRSIWNSVGEEWRLGTSQTRKGLVKTIEPVAYFVPDLVLGLAREILGARDAISKDLADGIAEMLERASRSDWALQESLQWLYVLAGQGSERAKKALAEIAAYRQDVPLLWNEVSLDAAEHQAADSASSAIHEAALAVCKALTERTPIDEYLDGNKFVMRTFVVPRETTAHIRDRAISLLESFTRNENRAIRATALQNLIALGGPILAPLPISIDATTERTFEAERIATIGVLARAVCSERSPALQVLIASGINRWTHRGCPASIRDAARRALGAIPETLEFDLAWALTGDSQYPRDDFERSSDWRRAIANRDRRHAAIAARLLETSGESRSLAASIEQALADARPHASNGVLSSGILSLVAKQAPEGARDVCLLACSCTAYPELTSAIDELIHGMVGMGEELMMALWAGAREANNIAATRAISRAIGWNGFASAAPSAIAQMVEQLLSSDDLEVKSGGVSGLRRLNHADPMKARELLNQVDFASSGRLAASFFLLFEDHGSFKTSDLPARTRGHLLEALVCVDDVSDWHVQKFLSEVSALDLNSIVDLYFKRIERSSMLRQSDASFRGRASYSPIPVEPHGPRLRGCDGSEAHLRVLRRVLDRRVGSAGHGFGYGELYRILNGFSGAAVTVLQEAVNPKDPEHLEAISSLVSHADENFVFACSDFVIRLLTAARAAGHECLRRVKSDLEHAAAFGPRSGTAGEPFPQDVALRDRATEAAGKQPPGSAARQFFTELVARANSNIARTLERDAEFEAGADN